MRPSQHMLRSGELTRQIIFVFCREHSNTAINNKSLAARDKEIAIECRVVITKSLFKFKSTEHRHKFRDRSLRDAATEY